MVTGAWLVLGGSAAVIAGAVVGWLVSKAPGERRRMEARLEVQAAELRRLADAAAADGGGQAAIRSELSSARAALAELAVREEARRRSEQEMAEVLRRLAAILGTGTSKGRAGEHLLKDQLSALPPGMLVADFRVNGRVVEYALVLPDGRHLPVDSKWSGDAELAACETASAPAEREAAIRALERVVAGRAREAAAYLDPTLTAPVAVAAVPDAAYAVVRKAHAEAYARGVVLVPYSAALPVLLFMHSLVGRLGAPGDVHTCLEELASAIEGIAGIVENRLSRASVMLANGNDEIRAYLGKARASLARGRLPDATVPESIDLRPVKPAPVEPMHQVS